MAKNQTSKTYQIPFIDYVPAQVKETTGENWRIVFYSRKPGTDELKRFRRRVRKIQGKQARMRYAKRICVEINKKLEHGWSPYMDGQAKKEYHLFSDVLKKFISEAEHKTKDNLLRPDTLRTYTSFSKNILDHLKNEGKEHIFTIEITKKFIIDYTDYLYYKRKLAARSVNNYLSFFNTLCIYMIDREYLSTNPTTGIPKRKTGKKKRETIPEKTRKKIFAHCAANEPDFLVLCLVVFFCFIRRTEISKLKVKNIKLPENIIFIPAEISKNGKEGTVTIPKSLKKHLEKHLENAKKDHFLFSADFRPGSKKLAPKKISDQWGKIRKELKFKESYQFYSLKDTGITELFQKGLPAIKIRDQARHHDIKITEKYTPRNYTCDAAIRDLDFDF